MKIYFFNKILWKKSSNYALGTFAIISSFVTIAGISLNDISSNANWYCRLFYLIIIYLALIITFNIFFIFCIIIIRRKEISIKINNNAITIKQGDIFAAEGKKLIPCNEYFDTIVDDIIIAKKSLHGIFIDNYVEDIAKLKKTIEDAPDNGFLNKYTKNNRLAYPIGRIITYNDFLLLSFTHFNEQSEAHLYKSSYAICLLNMWKEISRTYALKPIFIPLIGSGITRFIDWPNRSNIDLLKCMLYTLYLSGVDIKKPITILLTKDVMDKINFYELKGVEL
jgi:hypothetical protein